MIEIERGSTFVVVTGNPQEGQGKRLSEVRSHIAKKYHQHRIRQNKIRTRIHLQQIDAMRLRNALENLPRELHIPLDSPPLPSSPTGYKRMQRFMYQYVQYSHKIHPFFATVISAAVSHPALMSSKILNASAWDDISTKGHISDLTSQQCHITRRLISQSLEDRAVALSDTNIAALIAILLFDLIGDKHAFHLDYHGIRTIIDARGGVQNLGFDGHLKNSLLLIEKLTRALEITSMPRVEGLSLPTCSLEMSIFSLGIDQSNYITPEHSAIFAVLGDLYHSVMMFKHSDRYAAVDRSYYRSTPWLARNCQPMTALGYRDYPPYDARIPALLQTIQILNWRSAGSLDNWDDLCRVLLDLKSLLENTDLEGFWNFLPGALIWCLTIGVRLSPVGPLRTWFLMQTTRASCTMAMHHPDAVLKSLQIVLEGLDGAEHNDVAGFHKI